MDFNQMTDAEERKFTEGFVSVRKILKEKAVQEALKPKFEKLALEAKESAIPADKRFILKTKEAMTGGDLLANLAIVQRSLDRAFKYSFEDPAKDPMVVGKAKTVNDFKEIEIYNTTETEDLLLVKPGENYQGTSFGDSKISTKIDKYGRTFKMNWEAAINDSLGEFTDLRDKLLRSAKRTLQKLFTDAFQADTNFFNSGNANLASGTLGQDNLEAAMQLIMDQVDVNGNTLALDAAYLMVPTALKFTAEKLVNPLLVQQMNISKLEAGAKSFDIKPVVNPFLTSKTAWYLFCDPSVLEAMIYLQLAGHEGVELMIKTSDQQALLGSLGSDPGSFANDSIEYKVRMFTKATQRYHQAATYSPGT